MRFKILTANSTKKLQTNIESVVYKEKATEILSASIAVYNGLFYCLIFYNVAAA